MASISGFNYSCDAGDFICLLIIHPWESLTNACQRVDLNATTLNISSLSSAFSLPRLTIDMICVYKTCQ